MIYAPSSLPRTRRDARTIFVHRFLRRAFIRDWRGGARTERPNDIRVVGERIINKTVGFVRRATGVAGRTTGAVNGLFSFSWIIHRVKAKSRRFVK